MPEMRNKMPTGYTSNLETRNYDLKGWLKESVIRAMGVCVTLRDDSDLTEKEIKTKLKKSGESYYEKALKESKQKLKIFTDSTDKQLEHNYAQLVIQATKQAKADEEDYNRKKALHVKSLNDANSLYEKSTGKAELIRNTLKFAVEQLEHSLSFDYGSGPYRPAILNKDFPTWKENELKSLTPDVQYYQTELEKDNSRTVDRWAQYVEFTNFIDSADL